MRSWPQFEVTGIPRQALRWPVTQMHEEGVDVGDPATRFGTAGQRPAYILSGELACCPPMETAAAD